MNNSFLECGRNNPPPWRKFLGGRRNSSCLLPRWSSLFDRLDFNRLFANLSGSKYLIVRAILQVSWWKSTRKTLQETYKIKITISTHGWRDIIILAAMMLWRAPGRFISTGRRRCGAIWAMTVRRMSSRRRTRRRSSVAKGSSTPGPGSTFWRERSNLQGQFS